MNSPKKDKFITLRVSKKMLAKLHKYAKAVDLTPSIIIRKLLTEKLKHIRG